jgi:very-short-patch-repair endonuclease
VSRQPFEETNAKIERIVRAGAEGEAVRFEEEFYDLKRHCESPIEELLLAALFADHRLHEFELIFMGNFEPHSRHVRGETVFVHQQVKIGPYRTDFLFHDASVPLEIGPPRFMVVECDGHDFHERTKEQARRDKQRDRYFQSIGYKVLRFTGSEIFADPEAVADEILGELQRDDAWRNRER